jgi:hypothetical protein
MAKKSKALSKQKSGEPKQREHLPPPPKVTRSRAAAQADIDTSTLALFTDDPFYIEIRYVPGRNTFDTRSNSVAPNMPYRWPFTALRDQLLPLLRESTKGLGCFYEQSYLSLSALRNYRYDSAYLQGFCALEACFVRVMSVEASDINIPNETREFLIEAGSYVLWGPACRISSMPQAAPKPGEKRDNARACGYNFVILKNIMN